MNRVYGIEDLHKWNFKGTSLAVVGNPVSHSLSPIMHNAALEVMSAKDDRFKNWRYFAFEIEIDHLPEALKMFHEKKFKGLNLTLPHKIEVVKWVSSIDEVARKMNAINTLKYERDSYRAYNTDGYGIKRALKEELGVEIKEELIIILGGGGAARAAVLTCLFEGCRELWIGNRTVEKWTPFIKDLGPIAKGRVHIFGLNKIPETLPKTGVLINATSLGIREGDRPPIDLKYFKKSLKVMDMIYNPPSTALLREARTLGMLATNGSRMLVEQGARALHLWSRKKVPLTVMSDVVQNRINSLQKIH